MSNEDVVRIEILIGQPEENPYLAEGIKILSEDSPQPMDLPEGVCLPDHYDHLTIPARVIQDGLNGYRRFAVSPRYLSRIIKNRTARKRFLVACTERKIVAIVFQRHQILPR